MSSRGRRQGPSNEVDCRRPVSRAVIGFAVIAAELDRVAPCTPSRFGVGRLVADDEGRTKLEVKLVGGEEDEARQRLAAYAAVFWPVKAVVHSVQANSHRSEPFDE